MLLTKSMTLPVTLQPCHAHATCRAKQLNARGEHAEAAALWQAQHEAGAEEMLKMLCDIQGGCHGEAASQLFKTVLQTALALMLCLFNGCRSGGIKEGGGGKAPVVTFLIQDQKPAHLPLAPLQGST